MIAATAAAALAFSPQAPLLTRSAVRMPALSMQEGPDPVTQIKEQISEAAESIPAPPSFNVKDMPGVSAPFGFFDPLDFCGDASEGKIKFYRGEPLSQLSMLCARTYARHRPLSSCALLISLSNVRCLLAEVELKHSRVAMLASLGFLVGEQFHPLFGGNIDVPSYIAFQETPLQTFWPAVVLLISVFEVFSVFSFNSPFGGEPWSVRSDFENGDLGFDPLGER
eukprot:6203389-Pleurochrysis_carterae.AAC.2